MGRGLPVNGNDRGVSEVIGSVLLISIVVIGVAVIGVLLMSHPTPRNLPALSAVISEDTAQKTISVYHDGGDSVARDEIQILVDGVPQSFANGGSSSWSTWSTGQSLTYTYPGSAPGLVQIVYTGGSGATVLASSDFGFNPSSTSTVGPTGSATSTPTGTTTTASPTPVPAPVASFTGTPLTGTAPLTVRFTDLSANSPTLWAWNFGDGNTTNATVQNPVHTYAAPGNYTVSLTASNSGGNNTFTRTNYIQVTAPLPVANFTGTPLSGTSPLTVQFTDRSINSPTSWVWNFGDGSTLSTAQNPSHTYSSVGLYTVSLNATNAAGSNTMTKTNYVNVTISNFSSYVIQNSVFVYGTQVSFAGDNMYGPGATVVLTGPLSVSTLNGGASLAVSSLYINGDVDFSNAAGQDLGSSGSPGAIYVNGNMNLGSGMGDVYGNVYTAKSLTLTGGKIHGNVYVNGDLTLGYTPTLDSSSNIYYTGSISYPQWYSQAILDKCHKVDSVPAVTMPSQTIAPPHSADWYAAKGYVSVSSGTLISDQKIFTNSYSSSSWGSAASNVVIVASSGDITLNQGSGSITGVLYAPYGKATFDGGSFTGVVIAGNGFSSTHGGTTITFTNLKNYFSSPDDYPF